MARALSLAAAALLLASPTAAAGQTSATSRTGRQVYESVCITCHGPDGRGGVNAAIEKIVKLPDFSDCGFANREPDRGFLAVAHNGEAEAEDAVEEADAHTAEPSDAAVAAAPGGPVGAADEEIVVQAVPEPGTDADAAEGDPR